MRYWMDFPQSTQKSEKLYFDGFFLSKAFNVSARKFHRIYESWHWRVMQNLKENWPVVWKWHNEFCKFLCEQLKVWKLALWWARFVKSILDEKVQKSYVSWHWTVMQVLRKNWPLVPNMTWGIWRMLMRTVTSLKICTLMYYFSRKYIMFE